MNLDDVFPTVLLTATYQFGDLVPFVSYSKADQRQSEYDFATGELVSRFEGQNSDDYEQHELYSFGVRYDYSSNVAIKVQYDLFKDQGFEPLGFAFHGDSETIAASVDFVF